MQISINPPDVIEGTISYAGTRVNVTRRSGDTRPATVTLRLLDSGEWFIYQSPLETCGTTSASVPSVAPAAPEAPRRIRMDVPYHITFEAPLSGHSENMRTQSFACDEARRDARNIGPLSSLCIRNAKRTRVSMARQLSGV